MKRFTSYLLIAVMLLALLPLSALSVSVEAWDGSVASGFASGSGTERDPYVIKTAAQLAYFADEVTGGEKVGGLAGWLEGTISDCYTIGDIRGNSDVGGVAGYAFDALDSVASAERCYVMGYVSGYGIFGDVYDYGTINYCYNGTSSSPVYSDIQMQTQSTFKTFDFNNVWTMEGDEDYPYPELRALVKPDYILGDVNMDGAVDMFDYLMVKSFYFEVTVPTDDQFVRADMNEDGVIDMFDYLMVKTAYFNS